MKISDIQNTITRETNTLKDKIDRRELILSTYVGDPTRLRTELEKWRSELDIWQKCKNMIDQAQY